MLNELAGRAQAGDPGAVTELLRQLYPIVRKQIHFQIGAGASADDAVQETMIALHRGLPKFRGEASVRTWAVAIAVRTARRIRRGEVRHAGEEEVELAVFDTDLNGAAELVLLRRALDILTPKKREAFVLMGILELTAQEAGAALGTFANTAASRHRHACTELEAHLNRTLTESLRVRATKEARAMSADTTLEQLLARARQVEVRPGAAEACVTDVQRLARLEPARPRPWWGIAIGAGFAAAVAVVFILVGWPRARPAEPVRIGDRVAIVAAPGTSYRIVAAEADRTELEVDRGAVTARLWPGDRGHRLVLRGAEVEATATGTVYTLGVEGGSAWVQVAEGTVLVRSAAGEERVPAGTAWPRQRSRTAAATAAATQLLAMVAPPPGPEALDAGAVVVVDAPIAPASDAGAAREPRAPARDAVPLDAEASSPPSIADRWRHARLLRAQGEPQRALDECLAIADADDATWSPIALAEAARIALDALASPERAVELADRMIAKWPSYPQIGEVRALRCRALGQLGRDDGC